MNAKLFARRNEIDFMKQCFPFHKTALRLINQLNCEVIIIMLIWEISLNRFVLFNGACELIWCYSFSSRYRETWQEERKMKSAVKALWRWKSTFFHYFHFDFHSFSFFKFQNLHQNNGDESFLRSVGVSQKKGKENRRTTKRPTFLCNPIGIKTNDSFNFFLKMSVLDLSTIFSTQTKHQLFELNCYVSEQQ